MSKSGSSAVPAQEDVKSSSKGGSSSLKTPEGRKKKKEDATTGVSAASARAVAARAAAFYFRAPVKSFFRNRIDYMAFARAINPRLQANEAWSWRTTTPAILGHAVQTHGWSFIPKQVLPPLFANVLVGSVLYTTYLTTLSSLHPPPSSHYHPKPPPSPSSTFTAGLLAGALQSIIASPLDALHIRFQTADMLRGRYSSMWHYALSKTREIGLRGIFAGWTLSLLKDSLGAGAFFGAFEGVKGQGFVSYTRWYYGDSHSAREGEQRRKPHWLLSPLFLLLAGMSASLAQAGVQYPLGLVQAVHHERLATLDALHARRAAAESQGRASRPSARKTLRNYAHAYDKTRRQVRRQAVRAGGWWRWAYRGFWGNALRAMPSTSLGLVVFEVVRRGYGM